MLLWQRAVLIACGASLLGALLLAPIEVVRAVTLFLAVLFVPVIGLRAIAAYALLRGAAPLRASPPDGVADGALPTYTILVPLYREAHMLPSLVQALSRLDWPAARLDIKLILEAVDRATVAAAKTLTLPGNVEIVVVPDLGPRTKPKALDYALPFARGEYLVIYDAEDRPERDQLRRAFDAFRSGPPNLATVQARLNIYNPEASWLTRQFTLEYSALFDGSCPTLDRLELPIPLGGTATIFAWRRCDASGVGPLQRHGGRRSRHPPGAKRHRCQTIASETYEEAPQRFMSWLRQRTRWLKGFVQTWLVHMRAPGALVAGARATWVLRLSGDDRGAPCCRPWCTPGSMCCSDRACLTFASSPGKRVRHPLLDGRLVSTSPQAIWPP